MKPAAEIIILEDDRTSSALVAVFLRNAGYEVFEASEGRSAIELAKKKRPALLIADVMLPGMNGAEVVRELIEIPDLSELKVLFLSSLLSGSGTGGVETTLKAAGRDFPALAKPLDKEALLKSVGRILQGEREAV